MPTQFHGGMTRSGAKRLDRMDLWCEINHNHRLLFKERGRGLGFHFALVEFSGCLASDNDPWVDPALELIVEIVFEGDALHDGIRHMYWNTADTDDGEDGIGYLFWPDITAISNALDELEKMKTKFCAHPD